MSHDPYLHTPTPPPGPGGRNCIDTPQGCPDGPPTTTVVSQPPRDGAGTLPVTGGDLGLMLAWGGTMAMVIGLLLVIGERWKKRKDRYFVHLPDGSFVPEEKYINRTKKPYDQDEVL